MKISIITVAFNSSTTISDTITSVNNQTYNNIEHILVDGKSSDGTLEIFKTEAKRNPIIISEKDHGIYDAMNKGIRKASGDILFVLNSDDILYDDETLNKVIMCFERNKADIVYGGIIFSDFKLQGIKRKWAPKEFQPNSYKKGWHCPHPGFFFSKRLLVHKNNLFHTDLKIAADFEFMMRLMETPNNISVMFGDYVSIMRDNGASSSVKGIVQGFSDIRKAFILNGIRINPFLYFSKRYLSKLIQKL